VTVVKFGDGYEARHTHGINPDLKVWNLTFRNRDVSEIDEIEEFLDARGAVESFDWIPPRAEDAIRVVCRQWERTIDKAATDSLTARFEEVAEP
jgi:phage-related protein